MSQTSQVRPGAGSGCDIIQNRRTDNVTKPADNVTSLDNVTKMSRLEPRQEADCDVCDVCDIIFDGLSGNTSDSQDKSLSVSKSKDPDCLRGFTIFLYNDTVMAKRLGFLIIGSKMDQKFRLIPVNPC